MENAKSPEELTKSFVKQCKKININFSIDELKIIKHHLVPQILNENSQIDMDRSELSSEYNEKLFSLFVLRGYAEYMSACKEIEERHKIKPVKKEYVTKNGWKIIK